MPAKPRCRIDIRVDRELLAEFLQLFPEHGSVSAACREGLAARIRRRRFELAFMSLSNMQKGETNEQQATRTVRASSERPSTSDEGGEAGVCPSPSGGESKLPETPTRKETAKTRKRQRGRGGQSRGTKPPEKLRD